MATRDSSARELNMGTKPRRRWRMSYGVRAAGQDVQALERFAKVRNVLRAKRTWWAVALDLYQACFCFTKEIFRAAGLRARWNSSTDTTDRKSAIGAATELLDALQVGDLRRRSEMNAQLPSFPLRRRPLLSIRRTCCWANCANRGNRRGLPAYKRPKLGIIGRDAK